jgi:hypothetical protein
VSGTARGDAAVLLSQGSVVAIRAGSISALSVCADFGDSAVSCAIGGTASILGRLDWPEFGVRFYLNINAPMIFRVG